MLEDAGILTWVNRIKRVRERCVDLLGDQGWRWRVLRTSNAYSFVATLKEQLAATEGKAGEEANALREHNATLKAELEHRGAEIDTLKAQLAGAEDRTAAETVKAGEESAKTAQAIAAFQGLAERLEAIAEARRPWREGS